MISSKELQNKYNKLYVALREYIWPIKAVEAIADLEVAVYRSFPDLDEVRTCYNKLKVIALNYVKEDEDMQEKFEDFREVLDESSELYAKLDTRIEGEQKDENIKE